MPGQTPQGPFCQSCGMPMTKPDAFGTEQDGSRSRDYCTHCYASGAFAHPGATMPSMLEKCVEIMSAQGFMPAPEARKLMAEMLPQLKRWRVPAGAVS